jgi:hypothetical protein
MVSPINVPLGHVLAIAYKGMPARHVRIATYLGCLAARRQPQVSFKKPRVIIGAKALVIPHAQPIIDALTINQGNLR